MSAPQGRSKGSRRRLSPRLLALVLAGCVCPKRPIAVYMITPEAPVVTLLPLVSSTAAVTSDNPDQ